MLAEIGMRACGAHADGSAKKPQEAKRLHAAKRHKVDADAGEDGGDDSDAEHSEEGL